MQNSPAIQARSLQVAVSQVADHLAEAEQRGQLFFGHGTDNAWDEAAALVLYAANLPVNGTYAEDLPLDPAVVERANELLAQRIVSRQPLAYLVGEAQFAGLTLRCDERALVPRSPIAELIQHQFAPWVDAARVERILDLCTGGGAIALACAKAFPEARVDASDISEAALQLAQENRELLGLQERVRLFRGNLFEPLIEQRYDLIISNPPYVPEGEQATVPEEYQHEPALGLFSGPQGLDLPSQILDQAPGYLQPGGVLVVEVGAGWPQFAERYPDYPFTWLEFAQGGEGVFLLEGAQWPLAPQAADTPGEQGRRLT